MKGLEHELPRVTQSEVCDAPLGPFLLRLDNQTSRVVENVMSASKRFHRAESVVKKQVGVKRSHGCKGYVEPFDSQVDRRYESFDFGKELSLAAEDSQCRRVLFAPNQWPAIDGFAEDVMMAFDRLEAIGLLIARSWITRTGASHVRFDRADTCSHGRLIHYFDVVGGEPGGLGMHTDYECVTLTWQSTSGIELWDPLMGWLRPSTRPDELLVFPGDTAELVTSGAICSCLHRVGTEGAERWSLVVFAGLPFDTPIPEDAFEGVESYSPAYAGDHVAACICASHGHLRELVAQDESALLPLPNGTNPIATRWKARAHTAE